jgi:hypothetical protein
MGGILSQDTDLQQFCCSNCRESFFKTHLSEHIYRAAHPLVRTRRLHKSSLIFATQIAENPDLSNQAPRGLIPTYSDTLMKFVMTLQVKPDIFRLVQVLHFEQKIGFLCRGGQIIRLLTAYQTDPSSTAYRLYQLISVR